MTDFGYNTIGSAGNDNVADNFVWAKATSTPPSDGTLTSISVYIQQFNGASTFVLALYTDSSNQPGSLVVAGDASPVTTPASFTWTCPGGSD